MFLYFIHVVYSCSLLILVAVEYFIARMYLYLFTHFTFYGYLGYLLFWATKCNAAVFFCVCVNIFVISVRYILRSGSAGLFI